MLSIAELEARRNDRAAEQASDYSFRLVNIAGQAAVYVISHKPGKDGSQPVYTVHSDGRCNCGDCIHRCSKVDGLKCKHARMVESWLADCDTPEGAPVETLPTDHCHGCGFPRFGDECGLCGSSLVQVALPVQTPEQVARRARYEADLSAGIWG